MGMCASSEFVSSHSDGEQLKTTPAGMHRFAMNYADAAFQVSQDPKLLGPAYFLAAHSIELSLKAFLLARGESYGAVRRIGHDLVALMAKARRRKLGREVEIDRRICSQLVPLTERYAREFRFEYYEPGVFQVPDLERLVFFSLHLATGLRNYCRSFTKSRP